MARKKITACPHCGSKKGYYTKSTYKNVVWYGNFDGSEEFNGEMFDNADISGGGLVYCQSCNKIICRTITLQEQEREERRKEFRE